MNEDAALSRFAELFSSLPVAESLPRFAACFLIERKEKVRLFLFPHCLGLLNCRHLFQSLNLFPPLSSVFLWKVLNVPTP